MTQIKFTNIDLRDLPRTVDKVNFVVSDLGISLAKTALAFNDIQRYQQSELDEPEAMSYLGTPVYDTFTFGNLTDTSENSYINILGERTEFSPIRIYNAILSVSQTKNIVSQAIQGRNGTIKQYISEGDFVISLNGKVSGVYNTANNTWDYNSRKFPETGTKAIKDICAVNANIDVSSAFLQQVFDITNVVITDYSFTQREGNRNEQMFNVNMLSDSDTLLEFTEEQANDQDFLNDLLNV